jgi:hypothetical protein
MIVTVSISSQPFENRTRARVVVLTRALHTFARRRRKSDEFARGVDKLRSRDREFFFDATLFSSARATVQLRADLGRAEARRMAVAPRFVGSA